MMMKPVQLEVDQIVRDPFGGLKRYNEVFWVNYNRLNDRDKYSEWSAPNRVIDAILDRFLYMYARGDALHGLAERVLDDVPIMLEYAQKHKEKAGAEGYDVSQYTAISRVRRVEFSYLAIACMVVEDTAYLKVLAEKLLPPSKDVARLYLFDLLFKCFYANWEIEKQYDYSYLDQDSFRKTSVWADPIVRALSLSGKEREKALYHYLHKQWPQVMRGWGWKAERNYDELVAPNQLENIFEHFAYEVALAVAAYDLDDSIFVDHPYYPADLVQYYREHVRHTRDAWREEGAGAGVDIMRPASPERIDLAKSKSKGITRWLEIISAGNQDLVTAVLDDTGKIRKVKKIWRLISTLADHQVVLMVNIKDDETLLSVLQTWADQRHLDNFTPQDGRYSVGADRCEELLEQAEAWFEEQGYTFNQIGDGEDAWAGYLVPQAYAQEEQELRAKLGIDFDF